MQASSSATNPPEKNAPVSCELRPAKKSARLSPYQLPQGASDEPKSIIDMKIHRRPATEACLEAGSTRTNRRGYPNVDKAIMEFSVRFRLTSREEQVLLLICRGLKNAAIAASLRISLATVRFHIQKIHKKIGTIDKLELVLRVWAFSVDDMS